MSGADEILAQIGAIPLWQGKIDVKPLGGGRTNLNFIVTDGGKRYVVRLGQDITEHHVLRFNELAASRAACAAGISPAVLYAADGVMVIDHIDGKTLSEADIVSDAMIERIVPLLRACHREIPKYLRGPALIFWVFHVMRDYAHTLTERGSPYAARLPEFLAISDALEAAAGPFDIVFGHNDLLAGNLLDDGTRLWLIDWDYAGFNSPLFDLGGLASNSAMNTAQETRLLELYFEDLPDDNLRHRYGAMKCASLLRETMWSMVSELTSALDVDYAAYTNENTARFWRAYDDFLQM